MPVDNFYHHIAHPFSTQNIQLKNWEKKVAYAGLALSIFGIVPGFIAFYGISYYFKSRCVKKMSNNKSSSQLGSSNLIDKEVNELVKKILENTKLPPHKPPKQKPAPADPNIFLDDVAKKLLINAGFVDVISNLKDHLPTLYQNQKDLFFQLFTHALNTQNHNLISASLACLDKDKLEAFLNQNNLYDFEIEIDSNKIRTNKALLSAKSSYFERLLASGMAEAQQGKINISIYSIEAFSQAIDCILFEKLQVSGDNLEELLDLANFYGMDIVSQKCEEWILDNIDSLDQEDVYRITEQYDFSEQTINALAQKALDKLMHGEKVEERLLHLWLRDASKLSLINYSEMQNFPVSILTLCKNLKSLDLQGCNWVLDEKKTLMKLKHLTKLESLDLAYCPISDISALANFPKLRFLNLSGRTIDNGYYGLPDKRIRDISVLEHLVNLESLDLWECFDIKNFDSLKKLTKLKKLRLPNDKS